MWSLRSLQNLLDLGQTSVHDLRMTVATNQSLDSSLYSNEGEARWHRGLRCHIFHIVVRRGSSQVMTLPTCPGRGAKGEADGLQIFHCHYSAVLLRFDNFAKPKRWINEISRMFFFINRLLTNTLYCWARPRLWCRKRERECECVEQLEHLVSAGVNMTWWHSSQPLSQQWHVHCTVWHLNLTQVFPLKKWMRIMSPDVWSRIPLWLWRMVASGVWPVPDAWCAVKGRRPHQSRS